MVMLEMLTSLPPAVQIGEKEYRFISNEINYDIKNVMNMLDPSARWIDEIARAFGLLALRCIAVGIYFYKI